MNDDRPYECPLCGTDFTGAECHASCPIARGCTMVRCPHCGYEFVESGRFADMLRRWIRRGPPACPAGTMSVTDMPVGAVAPIAYIRSASAARVNRLASYGIVPGSEIRLLARRPSIVVACGNTSVAMEDDVGEEIYVTLPSRPMNVPAA
jgi:Fe2+ transport system protein FeoA